MPAQAVDVGLSKMTFNFLATVKVIQSCTGLINLDTIAFIVILNILV